MIFNVSLPSINIAEGFSQIDFGNLCWDKKDGYFHFYFGQIRFITNKTLPSLSFWLFALYRKNKSCMGVSFIGNKNGTEIEILNKKILNTFEY